MILKRRLKPYLLLALALFVAGAMIAEEALAADWFNEDWPYRRQITIDHTDVEDVADPSATYADFPLLVFATGLSNINANGTDIRFTASDGTTELPREIESYSGGTLYAYVKVTLTKDSSDSTDDVIYMYYGNPAATEPAASSTYGSENVWDSNFMMVQHLQETSGQHIDSTENDNDSISVSVTTQGSASGQINGADEFDGVDDKVEAGNILNFDLTDPFSVCFWFRQPDVSTTQFVISKWDPFESWGVQIDTNAKIVFIMREGSGFLYRIRQSSTPSPLTDVWRFGCATYDGSNTIGGLKIYANGAEDFDVLTDNGPGTSIANTEPFWIGDRATQGSIPFNGIIDEVRVSNVVRTADWIETSYNNQNNPDDFLTISEQVSIPTMNEWGMIIFMVFAGLGSIYYLRRKRTTP